MVKLTAPMFSLGASGTIGKAVTFAGWKGRPYARERVIPANPKTVLQVAMRAMLKFLSQAWVDVGTTPQGTWDERAKQGNYSPFNAYVGANMARWRQFLPPSQTDPAPATGTPPVATLDTATGGENHITLAFTITTLNDVWGVAIFRSPSGTFTPSLANCIAVIPVTGTGALQYTDSGMDAGTFYYDAKFITKEGVLGADEGEVSGTAT